MTGSDLSCRELRKKDQVPVAESRHWHILQSKFEWLRRDLELGNGAYAVAVASGRSHELTQKRWFFSGVQGETKMPRFPDFIAQCP